MSFSSGTQLADLPAIAFIMYAGADNFVARMRPDGSQLLPLTDGKEREILSVAWSPDQRQLAFVAMRDLWQDIYLMDGAGHHRTRLSAAEGSYALAWSPNGRCLAVMRAGQDSAHCVLWLHELASGHEVQLAETGHMAHRPAWSPDGQAIAFASSRDDPEGDIYRVHLTTRQVTRLTARPGFDGQPSWSPDGQQIAFMAKTDAQAAIFVMDADGRHVTQRAHRAAVQFSNPDWSHDGQWLVFDGYSITYQLYVMRANGQEIIQLTTPPNGHRAPAW